jgi:hypothetical protein
MKKIIPKHQALRKSLFYMMDRTIKKSFFCETDFVTMKARDVHMLGPLLDIPFGANGSKTNRLVSGP